MVPAMPARPMSTPALVRPGKGDPRAVPAASDFAPLNHGGVFENSRYKPGLHFIKYVKLPRLL